MQGKMLQLFSLIIACVAITAQAVDSDSIDDNEDDCGGKGFCPIKLQQDSGRCGLWLGPSPIKNAEEHGFGLGIFTGKAIPRGTTVEGLFYGQEDIGEVLIPLLGSEHIMDEHPPLREVLWTEDHVPELAVEYPDTITGLFAPGLAAIAPCTSVNFNLKIKGQGHQYGVSREAAVSDAAGHHRSTHPMAGSFSYHPHLQYMAVRDIAPGEELTVECEDASFDGGNYFLSRYDNQDDAVACLDQSVRVRKSARSGRGIFAKRKLVSGETILSTPLVALTRSQLRISDRRVNNRQLLQNYCYGHAESDLLLLPVGPLVNYLNHDAKAPNAAIRWHNFSTERAVNLQRREEYHHYDEMKTWSPRQVSETHGMGLVMDVVALRDIGADEEIVIDYGSDWQREFEAHQARWPRQDPLYTDAETFMQTRDKDTWIRTQTEQARNPYPRNLELFCFYSIEAIYEQDDKGPEDVIVVMWQDDDVNNCFRPCRIMERTKGINATTGETLTTYTVELSVEHNTRVLPECNMMKDTIVTDVPEDAIRLMNRPYTTDVLLKEAFRHEIGVPDGFFPPSWMRSKLRTGGSNQQQGPESTGDEFKRKVNNIEIQALLESYAALRK